MRRRTVRLALPVSLAVHAAAGLVLVQWEPRREPVWPEPFDTIDWVEIERRPAQPERRELEPKRADLQRLPDRGAQPGASPRDPRPFRAASRNVMARPPVHEASAIGARPAATSSGATLTMRGTSTAPASANLTKLGVPALPPVDARGPRDNVAEPLHAPGVARRAPLDPVGVRGSGSTGLSMRTGPDGHVTFKDPAAARPGAGGLSFDLNDVVARAIGEDPYNYEKRRLAEQTFEDRLCLMRSDEIERSHRALFDLRSRMNAVLTAPGLSASERRATVFELWDECDEAHPRTAAAREAILAFVRRAFPAGGPLAYSAGELAALNRRRSSRSAFDPYGAAVNPRDAGAL